MTLPKAIEITNLYEHAAGSIPRDDFLDALKVLIEAAKAIEDYRSGLVVDFLLPLPGETEEEKRGETMAAQKISSIVSEIQALLNAIEATNDYARTLQHFREIRALATKYIRGTK